MTAHQRAYTYTRESPDITETFYVKVDGNGYVRLKADNLHHILETLGFQETTTKDPT